MIKQLIFLAAFLLACATAAAGSSHGGHDVQKPWGAPAGAAAASRTIEVTMSDAMRFSPERIVVTQGEVVKFVVRNSGKLPHELVLGSRQSLADHAKRMAKSPHMQHDEPDASHVAPGKTASLVWNFNRPGDFDFACLVPGHFEAGMVGKIQVLAKGKP